MQASIQPIFTWSRSRVYAGASRNLVLLVEWQGIAQREEVRKKSRKLVAREIELRIWLEAHLTFIGAHGCIAEPGEGRSLLLKLGKIHSESRKFICLEFKTEAMPAGIHEALWLQWQYRQPPVERIRELPLQKLGLEYTHHTDVLAVDGSFHVEKHMELLKTVKVLEETALLHTRSVDPEVTEKVRRQADRLLLLATRSGDMQLVKEAEMLYKQLEA